MALACWLAATGASTGCATQAGAGGVLMTETEISQHGTFVFEAAPEAVFRAASEALRMNGYQIAVSRPERGLIVTAPRDVRQEAYASGNRYSAAAVSVVYTRAYRIEITGTDPRRTTLIARPSVFQNGTDISGSPVWSLDTEAGERALWTRLFGQIRDLL